MKSGEREVYLPGLLLLKMKTLLLKMKTKPVLSGGSSFSGHCSSSIFLWFLVCSSIFSVLPLFLFSPFFSLPCPSWLFLLPGSGSPLLSVFPRFFQSLRLAFSGPQFFFFGFSSPVSSFSFPWVFFPPFLLFFSVLSSDGLECAAGDE